MCPARPIAGIGRDRRAAAQRDDRRVAGARVGELVEIGAAVEQRDGDAVLEAELRLQPVGRLVVGGDLPRQRVDDEVEPLRSRQTSPLRSASAASIGACVTPHEAKRLIPSPSTARPKPSSSAASPAASSHSPGPGHEVEPAALALEHGLARGQALLGEQRREHAGARREPGVQRLRHRAEVPPDAARLATRPAPSAAPARSASSRSRRVAGDRGRDRPDRGGRVPAELVVAQVDRAADRGQRLQPGEVRGDRLGSARAARLAEREHRRHEHGGRVQEARMVAVVEVERMRARAVGERGAGDRRPQPRADDERPRLAALGAARPRAPARRPARPRPASITPAVSRKSCRAASTAWAGRRLGAVRDASGERRA